MKRIVSLVLALLLMCSVCFAAELPTLADALSNSKLTGRIEIANEFDKYVYSNQGNLKYDNVKVVILERVAPGKEFTALDSGYPYDFIEGFPEGYEGVDTGEARVYLRKDLMQKLNKRFRATSWSGCTWIVMLDNVYELSGNLSSTSFSYSNNSEMPEFDNLDDMYEWLADREVEIDSITYYPVFGCYSLVTIYNKGDKKSALWDYKYVNHTVQSKNAKATQVWDNIKVLADIWISAECEEADGLDDLIDSCEGFITEKGRNSWKTMAEEGNYSLLSERAFKSIWTLAKKLIEHDPESTDYYNMIIEAQDFDSLKAYVEYCNYNGLEKEISQIGTDGDYLGARDQKWMDGIAKDIIEQLNSAAH